MVQEGRGSQIIRGHTFSKSLLSVPIDRGFKPDIGFSDRTCLIYSRLSWQVASCLSVDMTVYTALRNITRHNRRGIQNKDGIIADNISGPFQSHVSVILT